MSGRRLDVTATQAVSSLLATLTGAIAASGLGIAGTIIGAAFMSLASTVGAAVYKHYLARSNERLRTAAASLAPWTSGNAAAAAVARRQLAHDAAERDPDETIPVRRNRQADAGYSDGHARAAAPRNTAGSAGNSGSAGNPGSAATTPDLTETEVIPALVSLSHGWQLAHEDAAARAGGRTHPGRPDSTRNLPPAGKTELSSPAENRAAATSTTADAAGEDAAVEDAAVEDTAIAAGDSRRTRHGQYRASRRWLALAAVALGVFVAGMGTITAFEAIAGKPLETVVWHRSGSGTTVGGLISNSHGHQRHSSPTHSPSPTTSPTSPASSRPTPTLTPTNSVPPTSTPTAPASPTSPAAPGTGTSPGLKTPAVSSAAPLRGP
jgi:hypothetical protein